MNLLNRVKKPNPVEEVEKTVNNGINQNAKKQKKKDKNTASQFIHSYGGGFRGFANDDNKDRKLQKDDKNFGSMRPRFEDDEAKLTCKENIGPGVYTSEATMSIGTFNVRYT